MSMQSSTLRATDLSARAKIRESALALFARDGFSVSIREIARDADVSPGLVVHHFGTKDDLRRAVDDAVLSTFEDHFASIPPHLTAQALSSAMADALAQIIGADANIRGYLRRCLLEVTPASVAVFDRLVEATRRGLDRLDVTGGLRRDTDERWRPFQVLFVVLGPLLLEPVLQRHFVTPIFDAEEVRGRTAANLDFISRGLFARDADAG